MAKPKQMSMVELLEQMKRYGNPQTMPATGREIRVRSVDAADLLREGKLPDILTPLVVKSIYQDLSDREVREFLGQPRVGVEDALAMLEAIDFIVEKTLVSGAKPSDLTLEEKRWIFRLAMGPAELLVTFRFDQTVDVESVAEGNEVREATE